MAISSALVLEGGAMRGIFSAGVLDAFVQQSFDPFDLAIGVSAGACNLASHIAEQRGRNRRCYFDLMRRPEFIDVTRFLGTKSVVDLDWLWQAFADREPLDVAAIARRATQFVVVTTSAETGAPMYLRPDTHDMLDALKGSCALPVLYRNRVYVGGARVVDGGVSDPIPAREAYRLGARKILVVRSRPIGDAKSGGVSARALSLLLRNDPAVARAIRRIPERYEEARAFLRNPPSDCSIVHVAPPRRLATKRMTQDAGALASDYALGLRAGYEAVRRWQLLRCAPSLVLDQDHPPKACAQSTRE